MTKVANWNPGVESVRVSLARRINAINSTRERDSFLESRLGYLDRSSSVHSLLFVLGIQLESCSSLARPSFFFLPDTLSILFFLRSFLLNSISPAGSISNEQYDEAPDGGGVTSG